MQLFSVKLNEGHKAKEHQVFEGYLGSEEISLFTRGEAIKKAKLFGGSIKPHGKKFTVKSLMVLQLSKKEIDDVIVRQLEGREAFKDTEEICEPLYNGDIFETVLCEIFEENKITGGKLPDVLEQELTVLNNICINADYIMLVD